MLSLEQMERCDSLVEEAFERGIFIDGLDSDEAGKALHGEIMRLRMFIRDAKKQSRRDGQCRDDIIQQALDKIADWKYLMFRITRWMEMFCPSV